MRITFVASMLNLTEGGSNFSLDLLARRLSHRGHNVTVVSIRAERNDLDDKPYHVVIAPQAQVGTRLGKQEQVVRAMRAHEDDTDLFHIFSPFHLVAGGWYRKRGGTTPVVGRLNSYNMFCVNHDRMDGQCHENCTIARKFAHQDASLAKRVAKLPLYAARTHIEPDVCSHVDAYFALSPAVRDIYAAAGLPEEKIRLIPNAYDPSFGPEGAADRELPGDRLSVLYVGRVKPAKGIDTLVRAVSRVDGVHATIVGDGESMDDLRRLAADLGVSERVSFEGWVKHRELPGYYTAADVFVHSARWPEPFGRTILESFQCGTPAIVSNRGGPPWIVGDAGRVFSADDASDLSKMLRELVEDLEKLAGLATNCEHELTRFEPDGVVDYIEAAYRSLSG
jgi:glycosyltransferase involved in cell wall biosynthesis